MIDYSYLFMPESNKNVWMLNNIETSKHNKRAILNYRYQIRRACLIEEPDNYNKVVKSFVIFCINDLIKLKSGYYYSNSISNSVKQLENPTKLISSGKNSKESKLFNKRKHSLETVKLKEDMGKQLSDVVYESYLNHRTQSEHKPMTTPKIKTTRILSTVNLSYAQQDGMVPKKVDAFKPRLTKNNENYSIENRRHSEKRSSGDCKSIKVHKLMSIAESKLQNLYISRFPRNEKLKSIYKFIEEINKVESSIITNKYESNEPFQVDTQFAKDLKSFKNISLDPRNDQILKKIKLNGRSSMATLCKFRYSFKLFLRLDRSIINDVLEKQSSFFVCNHIYHSRIIFRLNDFILREEDNRLSQILIESSSKIGLMLLLDDINQAFPSWKIWRNGAICD